MDYSEECAASNPGLERIHPPLFIIIHHYASLFSIQFLEMGPVGSMIFALEGVCQCSKLEPGRSAGGAVCASLQGGGSGPTVGTQGAQGALI